MKMVKRLIRSIYVVAAIYAVFTVFGCILSFITAQLWYMTPNRCNECNLEPWLVVIGFAISAIITPLYFWFFPVRTGEQKRKYTETEHL